MHRKLRLSNKGQDTIKQQRDKRAETEKTQRKSLSKEQIWFEIDAEIRLKAGEILGQGTLVASTLTPRNSGRRSGQDEIEYARVRKRWQEASDRRPLEDAAKILERFGLEDVKAPNFSDWQNFLTAKSIDAPLFRAFCQALDLPSHEVAAIPSEMTWKRFLQRKPITTETFQAFCQALHLDWTTVVDATIEIGEAPDLIEQFVGRQPELKQLETAVFKQRLVVVCGQGGIGKSLLVRHLIDRIETRCSAIVWRSLKTQPTLRELLIDLGNFLFKPSQDLSNSTIDTFLSQLKKQKKCLIVLDDWEAIMPTYSSNFDPLEYENYCQFIQMAQQDHQNCFLLLSRIDPNLPGIVNVRRLNPTEVRQLLQLKGVSSTESRLETFCDRYGNPKFIEFAIQQLQLEFDLDLSRVNQTTLLFSDELKSFLYSQIYQFSEVSQEHLLIYALVIRRGIATSEQLEHDCSSIQGIGNLKRFGWLEYDSEGYITLDPVILKYVTQQLIEKVSQEIYQFLKTQEIDLEQIFHKLDLITTFETNSELKHQQTQQILKPIYRQLQTRFEREQFHHQLQESLTIAQSQNFECSSRNLAKLIAIK